MLLIQSGHVSTLFSESYLSHFVMNEEIVLAFLPASSKSALSYIITFFYLKVLNNEIIMTNLLMLLMRLNKGTK